MVVLVAKRNGDLLCSQAWGAGYETEVVVVAKCYSFTIWGSRNRSVVVVVSCILYPFYAADAFTLLDLSVVAVVAKYTPTPYASTSPSSLVWLIALLLYTPHTAAAS